MNSIDSLNASRKQADESTVESSRLEKEVVLLECTSSAAADKDNHLQWKQMHSLYFHPEAKELDKKITISFLRRSQEGVFAVGRERTFFLSQFEEGKIHEFEINFQKNFKSVENASVSVRVQYIRDEKELIHRIIELYEKKRKLLGLLLKKWVDEVRGCQEEEPVVKHQKKSSQFGGWYDKTLKVKNDQSKSMMSVGYTSKDQSMLCDESVQNESQILKHIDSPGNINCLNL